MQITKEQVKAWHACTDGYRWFLEKFPQGGAYAAVHQALTEDKRFDDARWLVSQMYRTHLNNAEFIKAETAATDKLVTDLTSMEQPADKVEGENSSGNYAKIGSSGNYAKIGSSGNYAQIGSSGDDAKIGSSGDDAKIGSSGNYAKIDATGKNAVVAAAGYVHRIVLGEGACAVIPYHDGTRTRFAVAYVGENDIKANTPYTVNENGEFVEVD
ncbi:hypothetical protein FOT62_23455 [Serratia marcescens]|uniref:Uncharacterized protein n=1 Tax=Serratia marcescens TaxID=615 RepID=A0A5C7BS28_SERMA|nr:hypothetical protein [Serratia marcescens]TXE26187.1 hypothetical protein FOT62_23455 [Serratia marcescens]